MVDIVLSLVLRGDTSTSSLAVLRGFRIIRLLKIVKSWEKLQELLATIGNTLKDLRNFLVLLFICMLAFTLLGLQLFAYRLKYDSSGAPSSTGVSPRLNFDGLGNALTAVFIIFQGEQWHIVMSNVYRAMGSTSVIYLVVIVLAG